MEKPVTPSSLEQIRSEIDAVDRAMLELLERRFAAIEAIKAVKQQNSARAASPMRPAREAEILRRLIRLKHGSVPAHLMVRLWRSIFSAATSIQANVTVHVAEEVDIDPQLRDMVRDYFAGLLPMRRQPDAREVIEGLSVRASDVGVVRTNSDWIAPLLQHRGLKVIGVLPFTGLRKRMPALLMLGQVKAEPSGDDETLVAVVPGGNLSATPLWEATAGDYRCLSLQGFFDEKSPEFVRLKGRGEDAVIVGRCPCPLEVGA